MATFTDQQVADYIGALQSQGLSGDALENAIYEAAKEFDVSTAQIERATNAKTGSATEWLQKKDLVSDWTTDLVKRGTVEAQTEAFKLAKATGIDIPTAISVMQAAGSTDAEGAIAYAIDAFGRNSSLGWLDVGSLFGTTGDPFNFPYHDSMLADLHGGQFSEAAAGDTKFYSDRYGMGSDDVASYLTYHTGGLVTPEMVDQYIFEKELGDPLFGSEGFVPTPNILNYNIPNYAAYDKKPTESLTDYYSRLSQGREGGILGTRSFAEGMFNTPTVGSEAWQDIKNAEAMENLMRDPAVVAAITGGSSYVPNVEDGTAIDWNDFIETDIGKWINSKLGGSDAGGYVYGDPWSTVNPYDPTEGLFTDSTNTGGGSSGKTQPAGTKDTNYGGMDLV